MESGNLHVYLSDETLEILKNIPGKYLQAIGADKATMQLGAGLAEIPDSLSLWLDGTGDPFELVFQEKEIVSVATCIELVVKHTPVENKYHLKNCAAQFIYSNFEIRKIEIWAEKTRYSANEEALLSENTLYLQSTDGQKLLLKPWLPGPFITIYTQADSISEILDSGELYLKHIID